MNAARNNWIFGGLLVLIALAAAALRLPQLDRRPMHADEAVQAARFRELWLRGVWRYDPHEYHGPTLNYLTLPLAGAWRVQRFDETTPAMYRTLPVLFSVGLVLLLGLLADAWGKPAALCAGTLTAFLPGHGVL